MKVKTIFGGISSLTFGAGSAAVSLDEQIAAWLRITALFLGIIGALVSIYWVIRSNRSRERRELLEETHATQLLCRDCRAGTMPAQCPVPRHLRPFDCPRFNDP